MKRFTAMLLAAIMILSLCACGNSAAEEEKPAPTTVGGILLQDFENRVNADASLSAQELADALITNEIIPFAGASMPVEQGWLMGFGEAEITGFSEGCMFAPMIGSIAFVGYVFTLEEDTDADAFMQTLTENADPRWNICVEAEETVVGNVGQKVFFVMCPAEFEEA